MSRQPWIPRLHLFEIDDQPWFPAFLRRHVQAGLTHAWTFCLPPLQACSPATLVANTLRRVLEAEDGGVSRFTFIDFCAGAGGPTPFIERALNKQLRAGASEGRTNGVQSTTGNDAPSYAAVASTHPTAEGSSDRQDQCVEFVLTDLHPHIEFWEAAAKKSDHLSFIPEPVDASNAPAELMSHNATAGKKVFRLFNLAFHHFDDGLARAILKNTLETSDGFAIFELQERYLSSLVPCVLFGVLTFLIAPFYYWWSPSRLFFIYVMPVIPFVLVFDGIISSLRTRTPEEVDALLRTCGADSKSWELQSGRERFLWPFGHMSWIICTRK